MWRVTSGGTVKIGDMALGYRERCWLQHNVNSVTAQDGINNRFLTFDGSSIDNWDDPERAQRLVET